MPYFCIGIRCSLYLWNNRGSFSNFSQEQLASGRVLILSFKTQEANCLLLNTVGSADRNEKNSRITISAVRNKQVVLFPDVNFASPIITQKVKLIKF
jgi:hypothetical protein